MDCGICRPITEFFSRDASEQVMFKFQANCCQPQYALRYLSLLSRVHRYAPEC